jgi:hypothetical protein
MQRTRRLLAGGGVLALLGMMAVGCQTPSTPGTPRGVVYQGDFTIHGDTSIVVALRFVNFPKAAYRTLADTLTIPSNIMAIKVKVEAADKGTLVEPLTMTISRQAFMGPSAVAEFKNLPFGKYIVTVNAVDAAGEVVAWAQDRNVQVAASTPTVVKLTCDFEHKGAITVDLYCCPSATPTVEPTPTPVPTPTPTPANPAIVGAMHQTTGFAVDENSNIFLFGNDPGFVRTLGGSPSSTTSTGTGEGRIIKIDGHTLAVGTTPIFDDCRTIVEGEIRNGLLKTQDTLDVGSSTPVNRRLSVDLATGDETATLFITNSEGATSPMFAAATLDAAGNPFYGLGQNSSYPNSGWNSVWLRNDAGITFKADNITTSNLQIGTNVNAIRPFALSYASSSNRLIWSCDLGLIWVPYSNATTPVASTLGPANILLDLRAQNKKPLGSVMLGTSGQEYLLTVQGDKNIYYWNATSGTALTTAFSFTNSIQLPIFRNGTPYRIEKGLDGFYYVMLVGELVGNLTRYSDFDSYRIVRFTYNATSHLLESPLMVVDAMPGREPLF